MSQENPLQNPLRAARHEETLSIDDESVVLVYDPDGEEWFVRASSVPGLTARAETREDLLEELPVLIRQARLP